MSTVPTLESYLNRITSEYRNQPKFVAYVTALVQPLLDSQELLRSLLDIYDLDTAIGVQLDAVGKWIGRSRYLEQPLNGIYFSFDSTGLGFDQGTWFGPFDAIDGLTTLDDTTYRALLYAKRVMNNWNGTIPQIAEAIAALLAGTSPGSNLIVVDNQDMSMTVGIAGQVPPAAIISLLQGNFVPITPSGVGPNYLITSVNGTSLFGFDTENASISGFDVGAFAGVAGTGPGPVSGFALVSQTPTSATFSWLPPATGTGPYSYQIQDQVDAGIGGLWNQDAPPVSTTTVTVTLLPGHNYAFQVYAINSAGPGAPSGAIDLSTGAATNVNVAGNSLLPPLALTASATVQGRLLSAIVSIPSLRAVAVGTASGTSATGLSSITLSAIGIVAGLASGRASIPPIAVVGVAGQVGTDFAAAAVPVLPLVAVGLVTNPISAVATATIATLAGHGTATLNDQSSASVSLLPLVAKATAAVVAGQSIVITPFGSPSQAGSFTVTGTLDGFASAPALSYIDDATLTTISGTTPTVTQTTLALTWTPDTDPPLVSIPSAGVTRTQFTFSHPAVASGTHTLLVTNGTVSTTASYVVTGSVESADPTAVMTVGPSINASPTPGSAGSGNLITITAGQQVAVNGVPIGPTANVVELYYTGHTAYQKNASGNWYGPIVAGSGGSQVADPTTGGGTILTDGVNLSQAQVTAIANAIQTQQQAEVPGGEPFGGTLYPQNFRPGDTIIATAAGVQMTGNVGSLTDSNGDVWTLVAGTTADTNPPAWWWGGIARNGVLQWGGYSIAIRLLGTGHVWVEEAKQGGWWDLTAANGLIGNVPVPSGFVADPGPGPNN